MIKYTTIILAIVLVFTLPACRRADQSGPPTVLLGDSICSECGMIISDERFATSTVIDGERGVVALLFDDFNCQINFEHKHPELTIVARWSRDYSGLQWINTESGWFASSPQIRSPMASGMAFFENQSDAKAFAKPIDAHLLSFESAWNPRE